MRTNSYDQMVRDFLSMTDAMNRATNGRAYDYARNGGHNGETISIARLPIDAYSTDDAFVINAYVPGVNPEAVEITFENEELTIRGKFEAQPKEVNFVKRELYHGAFERKVSFTVPVNIDEIAATYSNGVLSLRVPKAEEIKPKQIKVQIQ